VPLLLEAEQLCRGVRNQDGLQNALFLQAVIRLDRGDGDGALIQFREMETLCRALENRAGLERALGNQAEILVARGQYDAALPLLEEQEPLCRLLGRKAALERCLRARLAILMWRNDFAGALSLCQEHTTLCRELGDTPSLAASLFIQASLVGQAFGRPREGLSLLREARDLATTLQMTQVLDDIEALRAELEISGEAPAIDTMSIEELARYVPQGPADVLKIMGRIFTMTAEETDKFSAMQKALYAGRRGSRGST
jgi:tetratricopeptide (TPR) repeat protein